MKSKTIFTKKDVVSVLCCGVFLLMIFWPVGSCRRRQDQTQQREQARLAACQANLKQWGFIFSMYTIDNDGYFFNGEGSDSGRWWIDPMWPYYRQNKGLFLCPEATDSYSRGGRNPFGAWQVDSDLGSYGANGWICNPPEGKTELWGHGPIENYWRTHNIKGAGYIPLLLDSMWVEAWPRHTDSPLPWEDWLKDKVSENTMKVNDNEMRRFCVNRHKGFVNGLFMDFSVRKVGLKELWTRKWHRNYETNGPWTLAGGCQPMNWPEWMRNFRDY